MDIRATRDIPPIPVRLAHNRGALVYIDDAGGARVGPAVEIAMERSGIREATVVPYEASAALSMLLLRDHGMLMVHFVGVPPGTADLLIKSQSCRSGRDVTPR
jgi:hypothetical protein